MSRGNRGKPSPFRLVLAPEGEASRVIECARSVQNLNGAQKAAKSWTGDVGMKGTITVEERRESLLPPGTLWVRVAVAEVANSAIWGWR